MLVRDPHAYGAPVIFTFCANDMCMESLATFLSGLITVVAFNTNRAALFVRLLIQELLWIVFHWHYLEHCFRGQNLYWLEFVSHNL